MKTSLILIMLIAFIATILPSCASSPDAKLTAVPSGKAVTPTTSMTRPIDALSDMIVPDEWLQLCPEDRTIDISSRWSGGQSIRVVTVSSCPLLIVRIHVRSGPVQGVHPSGSQATPGYGLLPYFRSLSSC